MLVCFSHAGACAVSEPCSPTRSQSQPDSPSQHPAPQHKQKPPHVSSPKAETRNTTPRTSFSKMTEYIHDRFK